jgi:hypothetical protein
MRYVIVVSLLYAACAVAQGVRILVHGDPRLFFDARAPLRSRLTWRKRVLAAGVYIGTALFVVCLLATELLKSGGGRLKLAVFADPVGFVGGACFACYGFVAIMRPDIVIRQAMSAYPDRRPGQTAFATTIVRVVGIGVCALGFYVLTLP